MRDTPPYEEHGAADATSIRHARLTHSFMVILRIATGAIYAEAVVWR